MVASTWLLSPWLVVVSAVAAGEPPPIAVPPAPERSEARAEEPDDGVTVFPLRFLDAESGEPIAGVTMRRTNSTERQSDAAGLMQVPIPDGLAGMYHFGHPRYGITAVWWPSIHEEIAAGAEAYVVPLAPLVPMQFDLLGAERAVEIESVSLSAGPIGPVRWPHLGRKNAPRLRTAAPWGCFSNLRNPIDDRFWPLKGVSVGAVRWRFEGVPIGLPLLELTVRTSGATFHVEFQGDLIGAARTVSVALPTGNASLRGVARTTGGVPAKGMIRLRGDDGMSASVPLAEDGSYRLSGVRGGTSFRVVLETECGLVRERRVTLEEDRETILDWDERPEPGVVAGCVRTLHFGRPMPGLVLTSTDTQGVDSGYPTATTDEEGRFRFSTPLAVGATLRIRVPGRTSGTDVAVGREDVRFSVPDRTEMDSRVQQPGRKSW